MRLSGFLASYRRNMFQHKYEVRRENVLLRRKTKVS